VLGSTIVSARVELTNAARITLTINLSTLARFNVLSLV
jgi:hypothetical protein